ncbi:MAG: HAD family hydrolase, partial [Candidatus Thermoplasmatota archaeon]|nr:HAD family hydrolase [Candidatus Thermoplasmatota archaeon]
MAVKAVSFDLWETIIHDIGSNAWEEWRIDRFLPLLSEYGMTRDKLKDAYYEYTKKFNERRKQNHMDIDVPEQIEMMLCELGIKPTPELVQKIDEPYVSPALYFPPRLNENAAQTLAELKKRGYKIGLISNTGKTPGRVLAKLFDTYGIRGYFDALTFSNETIFMKPHKEIFLDLAGKLGVETSNIVHVGDELFADIHGAHGVGMKAVWVPSSRSNFGLPKGNGASLQIKPDTEAENLGKVVEIIEK